MNDAPRRSLFDRILRALGLRRDPPQRLEPPDSFVREPRRPKPSHSGGAATLELPEDASPDENT